MAVAIPEWATGEFRAGNAVITDPDNPFCGLNYWKALAINDVLPGRRVIVAGGIHTPHPQEYIFLRMFLPGGRGDGFLAAAYDLSLGNIESPLGSRRVLSPILVTLFLIVEAPELTPCHRCGRWLPQSELTTPWWDPTWPTEERQDYLECRRCPEDEW